MEYHEYANLFPMMNKEELNMLCEDMQEYGYDQSLPIILYENKILDGRNRQLAADTIGVLPNYNYFEGTNKEALDFVVRHNLKRRHLDESQRSMVAARIANMGEGHSTAPIGAVSQAQAAQLLNVSRRSLQRAKQVIEDGVPELQDAVQSGELAVSKAAQISKLEPEKQQEAIGKAHVSYNSGNNEWYTPPEYIESARKVLGKIDLDPASSELANKTVKATKIYTIENSGLDSDWGGKVWMNPPYSSDLIGKFCQKLINHLDDESISEAIVLVNNATETAWFQSILNKCSAVCFLKGRVKFIDTDGHPSGAPLQGQAILYLGKTPEKFAFEFSNKGKILYA